MVTKVAGGIIGLGAISIGSVAFAKPEWLGINNKNKEETIWNSLAKDHNYSTKKTNDYSDTKFGGKYKYYLVGVTGTDNDPDHENTNKAMWEELFKQWEKDSASNKSSLGKGFNGNINGGIKTSTGGTENYLNIVCQEVYKSEANKIDATGNDDKYKESSVWKYCSGLGEKPKTISETSDDENNYKTQLTSGKDPIGKESGNRSKLISTKGNKKFWEIREKEFRGRDSHGKIETDTDAFFDPDKKQTHIKDLCEEAYGKESSDTSADDKPNKDKVLKYCSLDKQ